MTEDTIENFLLEITKIIVIGALALFLFSPLIHKESLKSIRLAHNRELLEKNFIIYKPQIGNKIKQCEALNKSSNGYHAGNWLIEVSDKGASLVCLQSGYRVPR